MTSRRGFLTGVVSLIASPAIVRASSLMAVRSYLEDPIIHGLPFQQITFNNGGVLTVRMLQDEFDDVLRRAFIMPKIALLTDMAS